MEYVTSLAVDYMGNIFWSVGQDGLADGMIKRATADDPNPTTTTAISKTLDAAYSLCYQKGKLFYAGTNASEQAVAETTTQ